MFLRSKEPLHTCTHLSCKNRGLPRIVWFTHVQKVRGQSPYHMSHSFVQETHQTSSKEKVTGVKEPSCNCWRDLELSQSLGRHLGFQSSVESFSLKTCCVSLPCLPSYLYSIQYTVIYRYCRISCAYQDIVILFSMTEKRTCLTCKARKVQSTSMKITGVTCDKRDISPALNVGCWQGTCKLG